MRALLLFIFFALNAEAAGLFTVREPLPFQISLFGRSSFVVPNEFWPGHLKPALAGGARGAYVSVGTERGFIGASLNPGTEHLILIDRDSEAYVYNRLNVLLLKMAGPSRSKYLHLRLFGDLTEWSRSAAEALLPEADIAFLKNIHRDWRTGPGAGAWGKFYLEPSEPEAQFYGANYLFDDELYARVYRLAAEDRISISLIDLNKIDEIENLTRQMKERNLKLSVLDLSNAWWSAYISRENLADLMLAFDEVAEKNSRLVTTNKYTTRGNKGEFNYHVYSFEYLRRAPMAVALGRSLPYKDNANKDDHFDYFNEVAIDSSCDVELRGL